MITTQERQALISAINSAIETVTQMHTINQRSVQTMR